MKIEIDHKNRIRIECMDSKEEEFVRKNMIILTRFPNGYWICPNCSFLNDNRVAFCSWCGKDKV